MTFKWTYIAAIALVVVGIAVTLPADGGLLGALTHIYAIVLVAAGGLLVLLGRMMKPKPQVGADQVEFLSYPEQQVLAILDDREAAVEAIRSLRRGDLVRQVDVYYGEAGAAAIDSEGLVHGVTGVTSRTVEHLVADLDDLTKYDEAVRLRKVVVAFDGRDEDVRRRGADVLIAHGAHTIQYFGPLAVQVLDVDRSRTRA